MRLIGATSRADVDFARDVEPWLGDRAAYFAAESADEFGLVFEAEDEGAAEAFARKRLLASFFLQVENGRIVLDMGRDPGGVAEDLDDTPRYRDAERRLRGAPTYLLERPRGGYVAARREGTSLRIVTRAG